MTDESRAAPQGIAGDVTTGTDCAGRSDPCGECDQCRISAEEATPIRSLAEFQARYFPEHVRVMEEHGVEWDEAARIIGRRVRGSTAGERAPDGETPRIGTLDAYLAHVARIEAEHNLALDITNLRASLLTAHEDQAKAEGERDALSLDYGNLLAESNGYEQERDALRDDARRLAKALALVLDQKVFSRGPDDWRVHCVGGELAYQTAESAIQRLTLDMRDLTELTLKHTLNARAALRPDGGGTA